MEATESQAVFAQSLPAPIPRGRRRRAAFLTLLTFVLRDYFRSPWALLNVAVLVGVQTLFYQYESGQSHFFGVEYAMTAALAAITTAAIFGRANRAETYPILARPVPRASFTGAMMLGAWLVAVGGHLLSSLAVYARFFGPWLNPPRPAPAWLGSLDYLNYSLPVVVVAGTVVGLVALLSSFISSPGLRLGVLATLALLVMSFDSRNFPVEAARPILERFPPVLAPLAGALKYATSTPPDDIATLSLAILAAYTLLLAVLVLWLFTRRELMLE